MCNFISKVIDTGIAFHEAVGRDYPPTSFFLKHFQVILQKHYKVGHVTIVELANNRLV